MPEIVWEPIGPSTHTIPEQWMALEEKTIARCDCGQLIIKTKNDYGEPKWRHLLMREIIMYRLFAPQRLGIVNKNTPIHGRDN